MKTDNNKNDLENDWDLIIKPTSSLLSLNLYDVWKYRDLLLLLVRRDFVTFYKQTILGPIWFFIQPIFTTFIYVFVFGELAGIKTDSYPKPLFYMTGIIAWNYFSDCLNKTSTVFKDNANIFGKVFFPRLIMPISIVLSNIVKFSVQLILLAITIFYYMAFEKFNFEVKNSILLFPVMLIMMGMLGLGLGMIVSAMTTKYRDLAFLVTFGVQLLMYATPIIYPLMSVSDKVKGIIILNPMTPIIEGIRLSILGAGYLTINSFIYALIFTIVTLMIGVIVFNKVEKTFIDTV